MIAQPRLVCSIFEGIKILLGVPSVQMKRLSTIFNSILIFINAYILRETAEDYDFFFKMLKFWNVIL